MDFSSLPCMQHAPPISSFLTTSPEQYLVKRTSYEDPHCAVFSKLLPLLPLRSKYSPQHLALTLNICSFPRVRDQVSHSHNPGTYQRKVSLLPHESTCRFLVNNMSCVRVRDELLS